MNRKFVDRSIGSLPTLYLFRNRVQSEIETILIELIHIFSKMPAVEEQSGRKRKSRFQESDQVGEGKSPPKTMKMESGEKKSSSTTTITEDPKIREIMEQAQRMIEQRKKEVLQMFPPKTINQGQAEKFLQDTMMEKSQRADDLKERIANRMKSIGSFVQAAERQPGEPKPLILDSDGRTIDTTGREIRLVHREPTLKANIRAEKRAQFNKAVKETTQAVEEKTEESSDFYDPRVMAKGVVRPKRGLKFHEKGEFETLANRMRAKAKLEKLQQGIASVAKKTGISTAVKLAMVAPRAADSSEFEVPAVEWWDSVILNESGYDDPISDETLAPTITNLVEHPVQLRAPGDTGETKYLKVFLTKKERKKLRRQNRKETQREEQEKIRLGLEPPPDPKVKISNLMRVLGSQAIMDPTKMEAHVRDQMAKRLKKHEEANEARKLTPAQKTEKRVKKLKESAGVGVPGANLQSVQVAVYRITDLSNPSRKFKVEMNAKQLYLTGIAILHKDVNVLVVEGGPKAQKFFKNLMLKRIKWDEETAKEAKARAEAAASGQPEKPKNSCILVWEGEVKKRAFGEMKFKACPMEKMARELFQKHRVEHYWDLAYSGSVLDEDGD